MRFPKLYGCLAVLFLTAPVLLGMIFQWQVVGVLTVYGVANILHYVIQFVAAIGNRKQVAQLPELSFIPPYGILVVGHEENEHYFRVCLQKIRHIASYKHLFVVQDGTASYMSDIVKEVFPDAMHLELKTWLSETRDAERQLLAASLETHTVISITQPHHGKREAMYSGLVLALLLNDMQYLLCTDSDTWIEPTAPHELLRVLESDILIGASTGHVKIFNIENVLAFLIDLKYWFAFNLERAAQSYFRCVSCVSGPLGMYRLSALQEVLEAWKHQRFLGKPTTYGDDRHMTNLLLAKGWRILYTHLAVAYTETPSSLTRWFTQQTRWGRSFVREYFIGLPFFYKVSWWLIYDLTYLMFYSLFLFAFSVIMLISVEFPSLLKIVATAVLVAGFRALFGVWIERKWSYLFFSFFGILYFCFLLPLKIWAAITLRLTSWGTSSRKNMVTSFLDCWPVVAWLVFLGYCSVKSLQLYDWSGGLSALSWICVVFVGFMALISVSVFMRSRTWLYSTEKRAAVESSETILPHNVVS